MIEIPVPKLYIYIYIWEFLLNPVVFVKGKLILGFCNLAAIWIETQAAQERARESARILYIYIYIHANFVFIFLHIISWNILHVCLCRPGIGWARGHRTKSKRSPPAVSRNRGYLPTHHLRHIADVCACACVCMWKVLQSTFLSYHTFLKGISLRSPNSPWSFWFPKRPFWKASAQIKLVTGPTEVWNWSETPSY